MKVARVNAARRVMLSSPSGIGGDTALPALDDLTDVDTSGVAPGDTIVWDGSEWVPGTGGGPSGTSGVYTNETQAIQARRYLMQDGTFHDPFISGLGTLTVGSITTVTDDTKYNAWPSIVRIRENQIFLGYTKGDTHNSDNTGKAVGKIGIEGLGGVITWGSEFDIYDDPSEWVSLTGVTILSTGRIVVSMFRHPSATNPVDGAYVITSDDMGATWGSLVTVNASFTDYSYGSGRAMELPNGDLLQCVEGKDTGDTFSSIVVLTSTDQGDTWGGEVTLASGTRNYYEACLGLLDDDTILVLLRTTDGNGDIYQSSSTDGGATWATPTLAFAGHGQPNWLQLSTGTLIAITRENDGSLQGDVWAYTSIDRGATWDGPTTLDATMYEMEYGATVELLDGRLLVAYGYQPSSATTNSDIKQVYVTEAVTTSGGGGGTEGHWEVLMDGGSPPLPLESGSGTDWLYVFVS